MTSTVVLAWNRHGELLPTRVASRAGTSTSGHLEGSGDARETAARELREETGVVVPVAELRPAGFVRLRLEALRPERYGYPYPVSYMVAWTCQVRHTQRSPAAGSECVAAAWFALEAAQRHLGGGAWWPLARTAADQPKRPEM